MRALTLIPKHPEFRLFNRLLAQFVISLFALTSVPPSRAHAAASEVTPFHFGFSSSILVNVNQNDARAAVKVWAQVIAKERNIPAAPDALILNGTEEISAALRAGSLDAIAMTITEYRLLNRQYRFSDFFLAVQGGQTNVDYLLLVHRDNPIQDLSKLKERHLICHENPRSSLALIWLDTLLLQQGLQPVTGFFGKVSRPLKLSSVVLPVFFRKVDACVVDRLGFETLCELNPQIGKQLKILAASPPMVPMLFGMRPDYPSALKGRIKDALSQLHTSPAGQQVLTVLQFEKIQTTEASSLKNALDLLSTHDRLCGRTNIVISEVSSPEQTTKEPGHL